MSTLFRDPPVTPDTLGLPAPPEAPALPMPVGLPDLGMGPRPQMPAPPPMMGPPSGPDGKQALIRLLVAGLAAGLGPKRGGLGLATGLNQFSQQQAEDAATRQALLQRQQQQQYAYQQDRYEVDARAWADEAQRKQALLQQNLTKLRETIPTLKTKQAYDQYVEAYAGGLQALGYRLDANYLRKAVPYIAPDATTSAQKTLDAFLKSPVNKTLLEEHPEQLDKITVRFDRDGDGVPENVTLTDLADLAQMPFGRDPAGKLMVFPKGTTTDAKASADGILASLLAQDKAEGKADTPQRRIELQKLAITQAKEAGDLGPDPTLQAIRELTLQNAQGNAKGLPPAQQRRVDSLVKGFDAQPGVKNAQLMAEAVSFAKSLDPNTKNPADDQALIYAFAKAMDPNSVVREGEYATVQKYAQSWAQTFGFNAARLFSNTPFLSPQSRANMKATITRKFEAGRGQYQNLRKSYGTRINRITGGSDGEEYLTDYGGAFPEDEPPPAAQTPTVTPDSAREKYRQRQGSR